MEISQIILFNYAAVFSVRLKSFEKHAYDKYKNTDGDVMFQFFVMPVSLVRNKQNDFHCEHNVNILVFFKYLMSFDDIGLWVF